VKGEGRIKQNGAIKFRRNPADKKQEVSFDSVTKVKVKNFYGPDKFFVLAKIEDKRKPLVLELIEDGTVQLLLKTKSGTSYTPNSSMGTGMTSYTKTDYYVRKVDEAAVHLGANQGFTRNFKLAASSYFKDCEVLATKIYNKEYVRDDIEAVVRYYNTECSQGKK
ncbi:MAG: hypothetical protein R3359_10815, partial [Marinirhabdus sp.]|nr:hypothetical protein [Marinirhabdus sp.]